MRIIKEKKVVDSSVRIDFLSNVISSFFFTGYSPKASGTVASFASLFIFYFKIFENPFLLFILIVVSFITGVFTSKTMMKKYGSDPSVVVIDEAAGMWLTVLIFILISGKPLSLYYLLAGFFAFRFFDITKLQPAKYFDELDSGFGIMMDDIIAGIYAGITAVLISLIKFNPF